MSVGFYLRKCGASVLCLVALGAVSCDSQEVQAQNVPFPVTLRSAAVGPGSAALPHGSYGKTRLSFEQNKGQAPTDVRYVAHGQGYSVGLTPSEARIALRRTARTRKTTSTSADQLRLQLVGASRKASSRGEQILPGKANYFIGNDPNQWRTNIPTFGKVRYSAVYPGVDLVYYGNQGQLEYDFVVAPRANAHRIALQFTGARKLTVVKGGDLVVGLSGGTVRWHKPDIYQTVNGKRRAVAGRFVVKGANRIGFAVARYDTARPLVIDPVLIYSTYLGGNQDDEAYGIAIDSNGNAYLTGKTTSQNFPGTQGGFPGVSEAFVTKFNSTGTALLYSDFIGGNMDTESWSIAVDATGNAYIAGDTTSTNFPYVRGVAAANAGGTDGFIARLNSAGTSLVYSSYFGGTGTDTAQSIALGPTGNAYITGYTDSADLPTVGALQPSNNGGNDAFIARFDTNASVGASLLYATYLGGAGDERAFGIAVDVAGVMYITGDTSSADFPTVAPFQGAILSAQNAFVSVISANGTVLGYSTFLGGSGTDNSGYAIAVDPKGNAYVTGTTNSPDFPKRNQIQAVLGGSDDAFVLKLAPGLGNDASLIYSTYLGGSANDAGRSIAVDVWGNAYVTGDTDSGFTPFTGSKGFVAKIGVAGNKLLFGTLIGGSTFESNLGIAIDPAGTAYVTGYSASTDFPVTPGVVQTTLGGSVNAFVYKLPTFTRLDFNHDNQSDFLFQNTDGTLAYWNMSGDRLLTYGRLNPVNPGAPWKLVATAELNGDNDTDLLFQNSNTGDIYYWFMNGTTETSFGPISPVNIGPNWQVVGAADFDRDGYSDILFQNTNGSLYIWYMRGITKIGEGWVNPNSLGPAWRVAAVGDLNGDGYPDILFQNTNGSLYVWYMHGATLSAGGYLTPTFPGAGWNVAGLADMNADGQLDILFQNANTGQLAYWIMDGTTEVYVGFPRPSNPGGAVWKLVGPH